MSTSPLAALAGLAIMNLGAFQEISPSPAQDSPPRLLKNGTPSYPTRALEQGIEGLVVVEFEVDERGKVQNPRVVKSVAGLDEAAIKTVLRWKFAPGRTNGRPVRSKAQAPVSFCMWKKDCNAPAGQGGQK